MLCLFGSPPAEAECNEVVSVTFVNDVGWEDVYVYTWTTVGDQTTEFSGTWPGTKLEPTGGTYRYQCDASSAPAYIIFNNGYSGDGNQTADLVFQNGKSYSYMGDHEFANGEYLLRNVSSDRYLGAGNDWGTRASLLEHPEYVRLIAAPNGKYYIESQYSDGEGKIYFSGNYMDSPDKATLTIAKTERILSTVGGQSTHAHTIANGETYYGYDGASTILGKLTSSTGENALWEIVSVGEAKAALSQATVDSPRDATFLIADANFGRNNRDYGQWTFEASNQNNSGDVTNFCVESWHATFTMSQTLTGVPNGVYALSAQGFYAQDGSDTEHLPVFFANEETVIFPLKAGNENSMETASHSFSSGLYAIDPIFVRVTDGTLTIGARLDVNTSLWCIWDNFTLMYYGINADIAQMKFDRRFASCVQEITTLQSTIGLTTQAKQLLTAAMMEYGGIDKSTSEAGQVRALQQMESAIAYAQEGLKLVESLKAAYTKYQQYFRSEGSADASLMALLADIKSAIDGEQYESNEQLASWIEEINTAKTTYNPYEYSYWFDDAKDGAVIEISSQPTLSLLADVSGLSETIHALHIQVQGNGTQILGVDDGVVNTAQQVMHSIPLTRYFVKTPVNAMLTGNYWFDDEVDKIHSSAQTQGALEIDVSQLPEGFHTIHYQVKGIGGSISQTITRAFFKVYMPSNSRWFCWTDDDTSTMRTGNGTGSDIVLDVSSLSDGFHQLHIQVDGGSGSLSTPRTQSFVKIPQVIGINEMTCLAMADNQIVQQERVHADNGNMLWQVDVSSLPQGFHRLLLQAVTPSGAATNTWQTFFLREATHAELAEMKCVYAVDGAEFNTEAGLLADGTYHFDLDVSALEDGLHRIAYMLNNGKGVTTKAQTQFFTKIPVGGNGITEYWYWLNDNDSNPKKVTLPTRQDPFSLISLLPVESQPLRSSLFQFRVENGQPVIYAKNDFHIRFYDASGRFTDATKQYVDEQVSQAVTGVTLLQSGVRATTDRPAENGIKWYYLTAEPGDSLSFMLDRAATIQLFSPTGKEVFAASGAQSVNWGGIHAEEAGTFFVALHDVTATYGNTISIDYEHIDRYAVLRQDVTTVGNGGPSTINFQGNGFDELTSVDLVLDGTTISSAAVEAKGKATVSVKWNFTDAPLGQYKAVFHFAEGNVTVEKCITVEQAKDIELATTVSYPSNFLLGTSTTYTIKIANKGNMTAYDVPIYVYFSSPNSEGIRKIELSGDGVKNLSNSKFSHQLSEETLAAWRESEKTKGLLAYLIEGEEISEDTGELATIRNGYIWQDIKPNSSMTITVRVHSSQQVYAYFTIPEDWITGSGSTNVSMSRGAKAVKTDIDCINERSESFFHTRVQGFLASRSVTKQSSSPTWSFSKNPECPNGPSGGGGSTPVNSIDPNDIYGYQDEFGSKIIRGGLTDVYYTIEFENDPEFATASAHDIYVTDVLSPELFDLSTFAPTRVKIGEQEVTLNGGKNGVVTIDLYPRLPNTIAQVEWTFNEDTGVVNWHISSLDRNTMEPSRDIMDGVLPVNNNGNGIGQLSFDISLKPNLPDGTEIPNKATIVFDENEPIETPTWVNTISLADTKMGDVNGDGEINAQDASLIQQYVARKFGNDTEGFNAAAADVNGDGEVTAQDASLVQQYAARKITW